MKERKDTAWRRAAKMWLEADAAMQAAKDKILALAGEESCYGAGVKHQRTPRAGNVQYDKVPELKGVDLDHYRRPGYFQTTISAI